MLRPGGFGLYVGSSHDAPRLLEILLFEERDEALFAKRNRVGVALENRVALSNLLRRADAKHDLVVLAEDLPDHALVPGMLRLEPSQEDPDFLDIIPAH